MWHALAQFLAALLGFVWSFFPVVPLAQAESNMGQAAWNSLIQWAGLFGMVLDYNFLTSCMVVIVAWRSFWLAVRIWRTVLELIPFAG